MLKKPFVTILSYKVSARRITQLLLEAHDLHTDRVAVLGRKFDSA